jgi:hypothetical protein
MRLARYYLFLHRLRKKVERDTAPYNDRALIAVDEETSLPTAPPRKVAVAAA